MASLFDSIVIYPAATITAIIIGMFIAGFWFKRKKKKIVNNYEKGGTNNDRNRKDSGTDTRDNPDTRNSGDEDRKYYEGGKSNPKRDDSDIGTTTEPQGRIGVPLSNASLHEQDGEDDEGGFQLSRFTPI